MLGHVNVAKPGISRGVLGSRESLAVCYISPVSHRQFAHHGYHCIVAPCCSGQGPHLPRGWTVTAGRPPENQEFQWAIRDDAIGMDSGCLSTLDLFRPPASSFCIAPPSRHPTRSAMECGLSVMCRKMGCQLAGSVPCLATKMI